MTIRQLEKADITRIARIHHASWVRTYEPLIPRSTLANISQIQFFDQWNTRRADDGLLHFVAEQDGQLVGFISIIKKKRASEISAVYIAPEKTGRGFGQMLVDHAIDTASNLDSKKIKLWVVRENRRAIDFYLGLNFKPAHVERTIIRFGVEMTQLQFVRNL